MAEIKNRVMIGDKQVKVALEPLYAHLSGLDGKVTVKALLSSDVLIALLTAQRGGGSSDENWLTVDGVKVGRSCAILGAFYVHNNEDKAVSHFYKNGSYHIVVEKVKNLTLKKHKADQAETLAKLEDDMMEEIITPKEWKAKKDEALADFKFEMSDELKSYLVELTGGYETKEALATAIVDETVDTDFSGIEDKVNKYLANFEANLFPVVEDEPTVQNEETEVA